jgi:phage terminase small subunit
MAVDGVEIEIGPAMRALPSDKMRLFVYHYCWSTKRGHGSVTEAARRAGYGAEGSTPAAIGSAGWHLVKRDDIQQALAEQVPKMIAAFGIDAIKATVDIVNNPGHKSHWNAVNAMLERVAPSQSVIHHRVEKVANPEDEALQLYRDMKASGMSQEVMEHTFGAIGVARYERMLGDSEPKTKASKPKKQPDVIDIEAQEVSTEDDDGW